MRRLGEATRQSRTREVTRLICTAVGVDSVVRAMPTTTTPGVPDGASSPITGSRLAHATDHVADATRVADDVVDAAKAVDSGAPAATATVPYKRSPGIISSPGG